MDEVRALRRGPPLKLSFVRRIAEEFGRTEKTQTFLRGSIGGMVLWQTSLAIRILLSIVMTNMLGAEAYGTYAYAITWLAVMAIPTVLGFDHITLRYVAAYRETGAWSSIRGLLRFSFTTLTIASLIVATIAVAAALLVPGISDTVRMTFIVSMAVLPLVVLSQVRQSIIRGFDSPTLAQLPENIAYPVLVAAILVALHSYSPTPLTATSAAIANSLAWIGTFFLGAVLLWAIVPEQVRKADPAYEKATWVRMIPPLLLTGPAYQLLSKGDLLVLGFLAPAEEVGVYAVASRGAEQMMTIFYTVAGFAGASIFSRIYATGDTKELQRFTLLVTRSIFWLSLPLYLGVLVLAPRFLSLYGEEFVAGSQVMRLLSTTHFLSTLSGFIIIMLYNTGHARAVATAMGVMASVNVGLSAILIPTYGMMGAAVASGCSLVMLHACLVIVLYRRVGVLSFPVTFGLSH